MGRCLQKFLGNSAASIMGGRSTLTFLEHAGENYVITMPNIYAVGLFLGTMTMELADSCTITCQKHDLVAEIDFKFKVRLGGWAPGVVGMRARRADPHRPARGSRCWAGRTMCWWGESSKKAPSSPTLLASGVTSCIIPTRTM